ncbi:kinase-like protein [Punctularia strigosozonata HHB-11173 SS5]|uniref:kinase-like protein n=1 Tax=Punctularia strigosozonata (strain HHB-11173) TaxID=741275 RepID=UPI0004416FEE|nr:kinase-like protein [Punctularia strigosozonata HHB-11173 SS5]EIN07639.1 kinase-like protein [Punctularia strigosozonata HHB-11173 SS5]
MLREHEHNMNDDVRLAMDELLPALDRINKKMEEFAALPSYKRYLKYNEITNTLKKYKQDLDVGMQTFSAKTQLVMHRQIMDVRMTQDMYHAENRELLLQAFSRPQSFADLSNPDAQRLMEDGQRFLEEMRSRGINPPIIISPSSQELAPISGTPPHRGLTHSPEGQSPFSPSPNPANEVHAPQPRSMPLQMGFGHRTASSHSVVPMPQHDIVMSSPAGYIHNSSQTPSQEQFPSMYPGGPGMHTAYQQQPQYVNPAYQGAAAQYYNASLSPQSSYFPRTPSPNMTVRSSPNSEPTMSSPPPRDGTFTPMSDPATYLRVQRGLLDLHRIKGIPPSVKILNGEVTREGQFPVAGGAYSDVWIGRWFSEEKVALKALRMVRADDKAKRRFQREIEVWSRLKHRNIQPFYGLVTELGQHIHIVSAWAENGNVLQYLAKAPDTNRLKLMMGAARGLEYLHYSNVVHGNMKCSNILVSDKGEACVCDFGMSKIIEEVTETIASATLTTSGSARWLAPELIEGTAPSPTYQSDIYSFGMTMLECVTLKHPYSHCKRDAMVIYEIVTAKRSPPRPEGAEFDHILTDEWWAVMESCWTDAQHRPTMAHIANSLSNLPSFLQ